MAELYVVEGSSGTYDSYAAAIVSIFSSLENAQAEVDRLTKIEDDTYTAKVKRKNEFWYEYITWYRILPCYILDRPYQKEIEDDTEI